MARQGVARGFPAGKKWLFSGIVGVVGHLVSRRSCRYTPPPHSRDANRIVSRVDMNSFLRTTAAAALVIAAMATQGAQASDPKGNYIVRGIGARPCSDYMAAVGKSAQDVMP